MPKWPRSATSSRPACGWSIHRTRRVGTIEAGREPSDAEQRRVVMSVAAHVVEAHGARIPLIGLGTWELRGRSCVRIVEQALRRGYRHVDTAELYDNEREVGEGLRAAGIKRDEVFITTKVWPSHFAPPGPGASRRSAPEGVAPRSCRSPPAPWPNPAAPVAPPPGRARKGKAWGLSPPYRGVELHRRADRRGHEACGRAAGLQSDRGASVHRPVEGDRSLPAARHGDRGL